MDVKTAARVLDVLNLFAEAQKPLLYSEIAAQMEIPLSSCHGLLKTMVARGYLYEIGKKHGYYPTQKLIHVATLICRSDPLNAVIEPVLARVRDITGETALLAKLADDKVVYLIVAESKQTIRFSHQPGGFKAAHATSSGKALLSVLTEDERQKWFKTYTGFTRYTETTLTSQAAFERDLQAGIQRGWQRSIGENVEDVMSISLGFRAYEQPFAIVVAGPLGRMQKNEAATGKTTGRGQGAAARGPALGQSNLCRRRQLMNKRTLLAAAGSAIAIAALPLASAQAQDAYPDKPIRVIMPWAAGGPTDVVGRVIAVRMGEILGHPLVIESRPGASGTIGAAQVARAPADGYTVLMNPSVQGLSLIHI